MYPFAKNIRALRESRGMNQSQLADAVGVARLTVITWERGDVIKPRQDEVLGKLCEVFDVSVQDLIGDIDGYYARVHGIVKRPSGSLEVNSSGGGSVPVATVGAVHAGACDQPWCFDGGDAMLLSELHERHPGCYALEVNGDCMDRVFTESDHIFIDPDMTPRDGSIAVALVDGEARVRRVKAGSSSYMLVAESHAAYDDIVLAGEDATWLGVVFWWQAKWEVR